MRADFNLMQTVKGVIVNSILLLLLYTTRLPSITLYEFFMRISIRYGEKPKNKNNSKHDR